MRSRFQSAARPPFRAVRDDEPVGIYEESSSGAAKSLSADLCNRFPRVRSFNDLDAPSIEADGHAIRWTGRDEAHRMLERAGVSSP